MENQSLTIYWPASMGQEAISAWIDAHPELDALPQLHPNCRESVYAIGGEL